MQFRFDRFVFDPEDGTVTDGNRALRLTPKSARLLRFLVERSRRLATKDEMLDAVWADTHVTDGVLKVCVAEIRRILGDDADAPRYVETVHGRGYRFIAEVSQAEAPAPTSDPGLHGRSSRSAIAAPPIVGREAELDRLGEYLGGARRGPPSALVRDGRARHRQERARRCVRATHWAGRPGERRAGPMRRAVRCGRAVSSVPRGAREALSTGGRIAPDRPSQTVRSEVARADAMASRCGGAAAFGAGSAGRKPGADASRDGRVSRGRRGPTPSRARHRRPSLERLFDGRPALRIRSPARSCASPCRRHLPPCRADRRRPSAHRSQARPRPSGAMPSSPSTRWQRETSLST